MPIPYGHTRGSAAEQIAWLKDAIEAIEDGLGAAAVTIQYNDAGQMQTLKPARRRDAPAPVLRPIRQAHRRR